MKSIYWRTAAVVLAGALGTAACSDSNNPDTNTAPVANFTSSCTDLDCSFTDLSSDPDDGDTVDSWAWTFGDGGTASGQNPQHAYATAGDFDVTLTVTDENETAASISKTVTTTVHASGAPTANFDVDCNSLDCTFTDTSVDDGTILLWDWDFGDASTHSFVQSPPVHTYTATGLATIRAKLTVTDDAGLTSTKTTEFTISPAATLQCADGANPNDFASCTLKLVDDATVRVTLTSRDCTAHGNAFQITEPFAATLFTDGCYTPAVGTSFDLNGGAVFAANTELEAQVISGSTKQEVPPALHVSGSYPTWTLSFDDGEDATPPEPDFNDLIITVTATPVP